MAVFMALSFLVVLTIALEARWRSINRGAFTYCEIIALFICLVQGAIALVFMCEEWDSVGLAKQSARCNIYLPPK